MKQMRALLLAVGFLGLLLTAMACSAGTAERELKLAPESALSAELVSAPVRVHEAYRFALANPEALENVPCYCGCNALAHASNYDCYVKDANNNGQPTFETHGLGCGICVDITQDVMQMTREGRSPEQIRTAIVRTYSRFGPSNQ